MNSPACNANARALPKQRFGTMSAVSVQNVATKKRSDGNDPAATPGNDATQTPPTPPKPRAPRTRHKQPTGHRAVGQKPPRAEGDGPRLRSATQSQDAAKRKIAAGKALELHARGHSLRTIAKALGYANQSSIARMLDQEYAATPVPHIERARAEHREVLRNVQKTLMTMMVDKGSDGPSDHDRIDAAKTLIQLMARHARLFGLDAPTKTELTGKDGGPLAFHDIAATSDDLDAKLDKLGDELSGVVGRGAPGDGQPAGEPPAAGPVEGGGDREPAEGTASGADPEAGSDPTAP